MSIFSSVLSEKHSLRKSISAELYTSVDPYLPAYVHAGLYVYKLSAQAKLMTHWSISGINHPSAGFPIIPYLLSSLIWFNHVQSLMSFPFFRLKDNELQSLGLVLDPMYPGAMRFYRPRSPRLAIWGKFMGFLCTENCQMADQGWSSWCTEYTVFGHGSLSTNKEQRVTFRDNRETPNHIKWLKLCPTSFGRLQPYSNIHHSISASTRNCYIYSFQGSWNQIGEAQAEAPLMSDEPNLHAPQAMFQHVPRLAKNISKSGKAMKGGGVRGVNRPSSSIAVRHSKTACWRWRCKIRWIGLNQTTVYFL